jgi:hypothetical protein
MLLNLVSPLLLHTEANVVKFAKIKWLVFCFQFSLLDSYHFLRCSSVILSVLKVFWIIYKYSAFNKRCSWVIWRCSGVILSVLKVFWIIYKCSAFSIGCSWVIWRYSCVILSILKVFCKIYKYSGVIWRCSGLVLLILLKSKYSWNQIHITTYIKI